VCVQLHFNICNEIGVKLDKEPRYDHVPKSVATSLNVTILWNQQVEADRTTRICNNKQDIIIRGNEKGTYMLIDVAI
jgi:queuine/archaeosine tRNA-ribosyltransferase